MHVSYRLGITLGIFAVLTAIGLSFISIGDSKQATAQQRVVPSSRDAIQQSYSPIVKKTAPAVVNVYVSTRVRSFNSPFANDPWFRHFFGRDFGDMFDGRSERVLSSLGSGVIVSKSGLVVTNTHVVKSRGKTEIRVALSDKREFDAKVIAQDDKTDIAVLQIEGESGPFPHIKFADSDNLEVGDLVLAIGNPFGVGQTVTSGIISALSRGGLGQSDQQVFIQTDAAINPGNSGGALVDMNGDLVGINTMIYSKTGGSVGIGFAIPSNLVRVYAESAASGRKVERPWIGAQLDNVSRQIAEGLGLDRISGAVVTRIYDDSPAADAGLEPGDVVTHVDGKAIDDARAFTYRLTTRGIGKKSKLTLVRKGKQRDVTITLKPRPELSRNDVRNLSGSHPLDGARIANITPAVADDYGLKVSEGVVVLAVANRSTARRLRFRPGDVIFELQGKPVKNIKQLENSLSQRARIWQVGVVRNGQRLFLQVPG